MKKSFFVSFLTILFMGFTIAQAEPPSKNTVYYYGEPRLTNLMNGEVKTQKVLFPRVTDPGAGYISENGCVLDAGSMTAQIHPAYIIASQNGATVSDVLGQSAKPTIQGTAELRGERWKWDYLKFSMIYLPDNLKIEDTNYILPSQLLIARKRFFLPGQETPFMLYEGEYKVIDAAEYGKKYKEMGCPQQKS